MNEHVKAHLEFFEELGIDGVRLEPAWHARGEPAAPIEPSEPSAPIEPIEPIEPTEPKTVLQLIKEEIGPDCSRCKLHTLGRTQVVFGVGNPNADLMFVGEAPGADEDMQGEPFVGRAGQLLTEIITKGMRLARRDVYIANVVKCRPPGNRNPEPDEIAACMPFLGRQIELVA
ncbi:MAG TPA: uracil-DNA glycosylase, partial [Vicinamibacterales bacterium]|nr:uracil-DNA glycosylase [Vicinamibacterales bacterium]